MPDANPLFHVFLSHNSSDKPAVRELGEALQRRGLKVWLDEWNLVPGRPWQEALEEIIETAQSAAVLVGKDGFGPWQDVEMRACLSEFVTRGAAAIPVLLPGASAQPELPLFLRAFTWVDLRAGLSPAGLDRLQWGITGIKPGPAESPPEPSLSAVWNAPHLRNPNFTGRGDLLESLHSRRAETQPVALTQVLHGLGGIGKTQLALEYAYRHAADYGVVWWVRAEEPETLASDYAALAAALRLPEQGAQDQQEVIAAVKRWLQGHAGWLLILDNAPEPAAIRPYLPQNEGGQVIITSRYTDWGGVAHSLTVPVFDQQEEAIPFLLRRTAQDDDAAAAALSAALGELPLALAQAAAYIASTGITLAAYLYLFEARRVELWADESAPDAYPEPVGTAWSLSMEQMRQEAPAAAELLNLLAFLAPEPVAHNWLSEAAASLPEGLQELVTDQLAWNRGLRAFRRYGLVEVSEAGLTVHRLVQAVTRDRLPEDECISWAKTAMQCVAAVFPSGNAPADPQTWPACAQLFPHASLVIDHVSATDTSNVDSTLLSQMGFYLGNRAQYAEAKLYYERALAIQEQALGPEHPDTATGLNNLGYLLRAQGDLSGAKPYYERALAIREQALGPQHPDTAQSLNNLGSLLQSQGDLAGAKPYYERALAIREQALGPDHPNTATSLNNLGYLLRAQGDLSGAKPYYERALAIFEQVLGPQHPNTAQSLNNLGYLLQAQGDLAGAKPYFERAVTILQASLGDDHPLTHTVQGNLDALNQALSGC